MKKKAVECRNIRYRELPDLLFGKSDDGIEYFDATNYICAKGDIKRHTIKAFEIGFTHWRSAMCSAYGIANEELIITDEATGHVLIDECLALLFVAYIDPGFGVYMMERMAELLTNGIILSDTRILMLLGQRFTKDELLIYLNSDEK